MHKQDAEGNDFFICDFCRQSWSEERPMVEGHRGSLICAPCLTVAYTDLVLLHGGAGLAGSLCAMCLEHRDQPQWASPLHAGVHACMRCVRQAAGVMSKDPDSRWQRPAATDEQRPSNLEADEEDVEDGQV